MVWWRSNKNGFFYFNFSSSFVFYNDLCAHRFVRTPICVHWKMIMVIGINIITERRRRRQRIEHLLIMNHKCIKIAVWFLESATRDLVEAKNNTFSLSLIRAFIGMVNPWMSQTIISILKCEMEFSCTLDFNKCFQTNSNSCIVRQQWEKKREKMSATNRLVNKNNYNCFVRSDVCKLHF